MAKLVKATISGELEAYLREREQQGISQADSIRQGLRLLKLMEARVLEPSPAVPWPVTPRDACTALGQARQPVPSRIPAMQPPPPGYQHAVS